MNTQQAVEHLVAALNTDDGYRMSWKANIAMAFKDEYQRRLDVVGGPMSNGEIHAIANEAADYFLNNLCRK